MEGFRLKTEEELQEQLDMTTNTLGTRISQESSSSEISRLPLEEIKTRYPERYEAYLKIVRAKKSNQQIDEDELHEMNEWIGALNNLDSYITKNTPHYEEFGPRDKRQFTVFEDTRNSLEQGKKEGYIKLPTGVGKTVLFSRIVESLGLKTLIVVPSKILVSQTGEKLEEFTDVEFGKFYQDEKNLSENVTVITYLSLIKGIKSGKINPDEYQALILDEAHKALGEETSKVIKQFSGVKLGFTATPKYSKDKHVSDLLEHEIHSMGIVEAAKEGLISRFKSYIAYTDTDISKVEVKNKEKYDESELERAIDQEGRNQSAVELYKQEFNGKLAIAYCGGVTHAQHVAELFNASGISAEIISGDTPDDDKDPNGKKAILERFRNGETKVLCNARILIEGFDEPKAGVCLNLQPTLSLVDAEQRAGRVLRLDSEDPEKWAYIVDFIDRNPKVAPRTFATIAEASEVDGEHAVTFELPRVGIDPQVEDQNTGKGRIPDVDIKGLKVVVDSREVLKISKDFEDERNKEKEKFLSLDLLKIEVKELGISKLVDYSLEQKNHPTWPSAPNEVYKDSGWISWLELFGKEKKKFINLSELKAELKIHGIESAEEYNKKQKDHPDWPASPNITYRDSDWVSWRDLFGKEVFLTLEDLKIAVNSLGIKTNKEYAEEQKKHSNWTTVPHRMYKNSGWVSWADFFNKEEKEFLPFEYLKAEVRALGIKTIDEYDAEQTKHINWPSNPNITYKDSGWVSFYDLFGKEEPKFVTYEELKETVKSLKITGKLQYQEIRKDHPDWPSNPNITYRDSGWVSWPDLFEKFLTIEDLRVAVREAGINTPKEYKNARKDHPDWPSNPNSFYQKTGWVSYPDLFGR